MLLRHRCVVGLEITQGVDTSLESRLEYRQGHVYMDTLVDCKNL